MNFPKKTQSGLASVVTVGDAIASSMPSGGQEKNRDFTITIRVEPLPSMKEVGLLAFAHHQEIAEDKGALPFNPDYDYYLRLQDSGKLRCIIVRDDGKLVGYWGVLIQKHPHSCAVTVALGDLYFLAKEYRGRGIGDDMLALAVVTAKQSGAAVFITREKTAHPHDALFTSFGFRPFEYAYTRTL